MCGFQDAGTIRRIQALFGVIRTMITTQMDGTTTKAIGTGRIMATITTTMIVIRV